MQVVGENVQPWLRSADPELPTLATRAAIELDVLQRGLADDLSNTQRLSILLRNSLDQAVGTDQDKDIVANQRRAFLLDPTTVVIVARALQAKGEQVGSSLEEVLALSRNIATQFEALVHRGELDHLDQLREFCLSLAKDTSIHRQSYHGPSSSRFSRR